MSAHFRRIIGVRAMFAAGMAALLTTAASAQQPATPGPAVPKPAAAAPANGEPAAAHPASPAEASPAAAYSYNPEGRRDPFISLVGRGSDARPAGSRPAGVPGLLINEVSIKGIIRDHSGYIAMLQGSDNRTYVVKAGDRLMDGTVKAIVQDAVVFSQDVNDPLSLVKQKEIRKNLRAPEGGRG
jgi:type IV pilus assembly protein PilP